MTTTLILLLLLAAAMPLWSSSRLAAEQATRLARQACQRGGVQLLDQTVALSGLGLERNRNGRLAIRRRYQFDYSTVGHDRLRGQLSLLGGELQWITEPEAAPPAEP